MPLLPRRASRLAGFLVLAGLLWTSPANAAPFEANWRNHLDDTEVPDPNPTPFYDCSLVGGGGLICDWLWDSGLEISSAGFLPMYGSGNPFYDAFGTDLPTRSDLPESGLLRIVAACRAGMDPVSARSRCAA